LAGKPEIPKTSGVKRLEEKKIPGWGYKDCDVVVQGLTAERSKGGKGRALRAIGAWWTPVTALLQKRYRKGSFSTKGRRR